MRVWVASFLLLFGFAEIYQWLKQFTLPLPVYILGGAFLAIASNYDKLSSFPFLRSHEDEPAPIKDQTPPAMRSVYSQSSSNLTPQSPRPISFKIEKKREKGANSSHSI
ncbi:hypothetical protein [Coleofasciculus sp. FACHB-129]|uniref:hypothetical protein n=1 Tax=Cyanophyceae TaxID=3028117 RepID=UPI001683EC40|nr:hypothetical protein [Coleofasciculus sp. FACHB-129]MBD1896015.1 hypothetical protein [Coleofasciculus sp. FACHB-129]